MCLHSPAVPGVKQGLIKNNNKKKVDFQKKSLNWKKNKKTLHQAALTPTELNQAVTWSLPPPTTHHTRTNTHAHTYSSPNKHRELSNKATLVIIGGGWNSDLFIPKWSLRIDGGTALLHLSSLKPRLSDTGIHSSCRLWQSDFPRALPPGVALDFLEAG